MTERPILFTGGNVLRLIDDSKTQTRRIVKDPAIPARGKQWGECLCREIDPVDQPCMRCFAIAKGTPYGVPGDQLWVKETWRPLGKAHGEVPVLYAASRGSPNSSRRCVDVPPGWRRPKAASTGNVSPLFMPRWASRVTLELTAVRVERLQEISEADSKAEGVEFHVGGPILAYRSLWESINGESSWAANPWVWVIEFKRAVEALAVTP